jgi:hypothetical protein
VIEIDYLMPARAYSPSLQSLLVSQGVTAAIANPSAAAAAVAAASQQAPTGVTAAQLAAANNLNATSDAANSALHNGTPGPPGAASAMGSNGLLIPSLLSDADKERLDALMVSIRAKNPYRLGRDGCSRSRGFPDRVARAHRGSGNVAAQG